MELLSPAGSYEKLKSAVLFGADAVYFGGPSFSLRAFAGNFSFDEMEEALKYLHERGKKGYIAVNVFPHTKELDEAEKYIKKCESINADGLIISDPGIFYIAKKSGVKTPLIISTQANTVNLAAVNFWAEQGAKRLIMAREVSSSDLSDICRHSTCEIEIFVHGAICISMSGRCLMSSYMTGRDANKGECTHPCRWNYFLMEETREGEYYPVYEDKRGTYLYNSKDLCLLNRIGDIYKMGVKSCKIEGRMKSSVYVSLTTGVYRAAIDRALESPGNYVADDYWHFLLNSLSNRRYTEGFFGSSKDDEAMNRVTGGYSRSADFLGIVSGYKNGELIINARAKFFPNEQISIIAPGLKKYDIKTISIYDDKGEAIENTRPNYTYKIPFPHIIESGALIMRFESAAGI